MMLPAQITPDELDVFGVTLEEYYAINNRLQNVLGTVLGANARGGSNPPRFSHSNHFLPCIIHLSGCNKTLPNIKIESLFAWFFPPPKIPHIPLICRAFD
jgi:hypothetical protein